MQDIGEVKNQKGKIQLIKSRPSKKRDTREIMVKFPKGGY
jgi:hypothetical protein